jgi:hypothetical protein
MKYIKNQYVLTNIVSENIEDATTKLEIFKTLKCAKSDISIAFRREPDHPLTTYDRIRIDRVNDDSIDIVVVNATHTMSVKKIPINLIELITTTTTPSEIFRKKNNLTKGDVFDLA